MAKKTIENNVEGSQKTTTRKKRGTTSKKIEPRPDDILVSQETQEKAALEGVKMLFNSIRDLKKQNKITKISHLNVMQEENFAKLAAINPSLAEEAIKLYRTDDEGNLVHAKRESDRVSFNETDRMIELINASSELSELETDLSVFDKGKETIDTVKVEEFEDLDTEEGLYDVIALPSEGECYPNKKAKIAVGWLTATDENFITSPNLYKDGLISDCLIKRKVVDKTIDTDELVSGDADAIIYFLRVSSYGAEFPARITDPETNTQFDAIIDLSQIKSKDFKLKGDENGWFDYTLQNGDKIKFRYLTKRDERKLDKLSQMDNKDTKAAKLREIIKYLDAALDDPNGLDDGSLEKIEDGMDAMGEWAAILEEKNGISINRLITNRMEMQIMSVNGNMDRKFIKRYVRSMPARDSITLRRYIIENEPGLNFEVTVERPESLGGGSITTFLEWNDAVFLNIT